MIARAIRRYRRYGPLLLTVGSGAAVAGAIVNFIIGPLTGTFTGQMEDFDRSLPQQPEGGALLIGARRISAGLDPYTPWIEYTKHRSLAGAFDQVPLVGWMLQPFTHMSQHDRESAWLLLLIAALVAGGIITAHAILPTAWPRTRIAVLAVFVFPAATENLYHGNLNPFIFLLFACAMYAWVRGWEMRCGVVLGVAVGLKLGPAVLVVLFIRRRWWRGIIAAGASTFALVLAGGLLLPEASHTFFTVVLPDLGGENGWFSNMSLAGAMSRLFEHSIVGQDPASLPLHIAALAIEATVVMTVAFLVCPGQTSAARRGAEFAFAVAGFLLAGATMWYRSQLHVIVVTMGIAAAMTVLSGPWRRRFAGVLVVLVVVEAVIGPLVLDALSGADLHGLSDGPWWWLVLQVDSLPTIAVAATWITLAVALRRAHWPSVVEARQGGLARSANHRGC